MAVPRTPAPLGHHRRVWEWLLHPRRQGLPCPLPRSKAMLNGHRKKSRYARTQPSNTCLTPRSTTLLHCVASCCAQAATRGWGAGTRHDHRSHDNITEHDRQSRHHVSCILDHVSSGASYIERDTVVVSVPSSVQRGRPSSSALAQSLLLQVISRNLRAETRDTGTVH